MEYACIWKYSHLGGRAKGTSRGREVVLGSIDWYHLIKMNSSERTIRGGCMMIGDILSP